MRAVDYFSKKIKINFFHNSFVTGPIRFVFRRDATDAIPNSRYYYWTYPTRARGGKFGKLVLLDGHAG
jgi:hypothetical protein